MPATQRHLKPLGLLASGLILLGGDPARAITPADAGVNPPALEAAPPGSPPAAETAAEAVPANPYEVITRRNAFGLKDPPPSAPPPKPPEQPPVNTSALKLTGITTLLGKRAMFVFNDGRTNIVSDLVREGERDRFITNLEVLEIDADARAVKVIFGGQEMRLDFVNNGLRPPTNIVATPAGTQVAAARPGVPALPTLPVPGQPPATPTFQAGNTAFTATPAGAVRNLPARPSRLGGTISGAPNPQGAEAPPEVPVEQQIQILREQHRVARELNIPLPPPPPAPGLDDLDHGPPALPNQPPSLPGSGPPPLPGYGPPPLPGQQ